MSDTDVGTSELQPNLRGIDRIAKRGVNFTSIADLHEPEYSVGERAEQCWGLYNEYVILGRLSREIGPDAPAADPLLQRIEGEVARLWVDPAVQKTIEVKLRESITDERHHHGKLNSYRENKDRLEKLNEDYFNLLRNQFLMRQMTPTLRGIDMARIRVQRDAVAKQLHALEADGGATAVERNERGNGIGPESADTASLVAFERIKDYHKQFKETGIINTPSRELLQEEVTEQTSHGTWIQLSGETGSGKSTFAKRASHTLNGEPPKYAAGEKTGDVRTLIGSKTMDPVTSEVYYDFGPVVGALTGCSDSREMQKIMGSGEERNGKLVLLDELNKFDQDTLFGVLKVAATLRGGEVFDFKEMPGVKLRMSRKGFVVIATMNPATVRYERKELDPAIDRLFYGGKKKVDYLPMSEKDPELYEAFLGILMDENGRIRIAKDELGPKYENVIDEASGLVRQELVPDVREHGALYRFALATGEIHKSFNQRDSVAKTATDPGYLERTVLDMEILADWMKDYRSEVEGGASLTGYLGEKLHDFYGAIESEGDKAIFKRVFVKFGFAIDIEPSAEAMAKPAYEPLTPLEIGYITPKTERATIKKGEEVVPKSSLLIGSDGSEIHYNPIAINWEGGTLQPGAYVTFQDREGSFKFLGLNAQTGEEIFVPADIVPSSIPEQAYWEAINHPMVEKAKQMLGKDFIGIEGVVKMEGLLQRVGVDVQFDLDNIPLPDWNEADLQYALDQGEALILSAQSMTKDGTPTPVDLINFRELFTGPDPLGNLQTMFYSFRPDGNDWYKSEAFATAPGTINLSWRFVKKDVLQGSLGKKWADQTPLLRKYEKDLKKTTAARTTARRRTGTEAAYDLMLYYLNTGERLLPDKADWTDSKSSNGHRVHVWFNAGGVDVSRWHPDDANPGLGVCPTR